MTTTNPFAAGIYNGVQTYTIDAADRLRAVKNFDLAKCHAALQVHGLQKTVERAVRARIRQLEKPPSALLAKDDPILDVLDRLFIWHAQKMAHLQTVQEGSKEGTKLQVGEQEHVLTARDAVFFKLGIEVGLVELGKLPIKVGREKKG